MLCLGNNQLDGIEIDDKLFCLENQIFAYAKTKPQISCAVTAQLISAFVFATQIV